MNQVESESILSELHQLSCVPVSDSSCADIAVINTCSVTAEADSKTRKAIRKLAFQKATKKVYVTGCSAVMHREALSQISDKITVIEDKSKIAQAIMDDFPLSESMEIPHTIDADFLHTRAFIKVQDGCENFCSYCIVPYARGTSQSVPFDMVLSEFAAAEKRGVREIVLTGINIGRYTDASHAISSLDELAQEILKTSIERVRISSIEPPDVTPQFIETLASNERICPHIHLPLQSGSDSVLKRMNRRYTTSEYAVIVSKLREQMPHLALTTDVIVGFPGETEQEFEETLRFCRQMEFSKIHVFKYSVRPNTPAAGMPQVSPQLISDRAALLRSLSDEMRESYKASFSGRNIEVLVERIEDGYFTGTSREYISYRRPLADALGDAHIEVGSIVTVLG